MTRYLLNHQNPDGGFGLHIEGHSTMFGTALRCVCVWGGQGGIVGRSGRRGCGCRRLCRASRVPRARAAPNARLPCGRLALGAQRPPPHRPPPPPKPRSYVTLRLLGVEADAPEIVRAREWVSRRRLGPPWSARASAVGPRDLQCRALH
jgi:hypothetical protein